MTLFGFIHWPRRVEESEAIAKAEAREDDMRQARNHFEHSLRQLDEALRERKPVSLRRKPNGGQPDGG